MSKMFIIGKFCFSKEDDGSLNMNLLNMNTKGINSKTRLKAVLNSLFDVIRTPEAIKRFWDKYEFFGIAEKTIDVGHGYLVRLKCVGEKSSEKPSDWIIEFEHDGVIESLNFIKLNTNGDAMISIEFLHWLNDIKI